MAEMIFNTTINPFNTTTISPHADTNALIIGYICIFISCILFGVFNLPVNKRIIVFFLIKVWKLKFKKAKTFETGDGMFFQLLVATGNYKFMNII